MRESLEKAAERTRKRMAHRRDITSLVKITAGCADCGYDAHPAALDFDHLGAKFKDISKMHMHSWAKIWEEIAACDVVCANCHRIRTYERRRNA